jgi:hypothetical protein
LIEVLVALLIFGTVTAAIYAIYNNSAKAFFSQENSVQLTQDTRAAMELMCWEVRMAGFVDIDEGGWNTVGFLDKPSGGDPDTWRTAADSIHFAMDITGGESDGLDNDGDGTTDEADESRFGDGDVTDAGEDINYFLQNGTIFRRARTVSGGAGAFQVQPVIGNVTALQFQYFNRSGTAIATPLDEDDREAIRSVEITLAAESARLDPIAHDRKDSALVQRIRVRNAGLVADLANEFEL